MNIMTKRGSQDNVATYEHLCDTAADLQNIDPRYITLGSIAIILQGTSGGLEIYIADSNKQWNSLTTISGGISGGDFAPDISNPQDGDTLVYNGTAGKWVNGAASGGGGGLVMTATIDLSTMIATANKTAQEIYDAFMAGRQVVGVIELMGVTQAFSLVNLFYSNSGVWFYFYDADESKSKTYTYGASNMTDYPTCDLGGSPSN